MKLLIVAPWPLRALGGGARLARDIGAALARYHGWQVHAAAGSGLPNHPYVPADAEGPIAETRLTLLQEAGAATTIDGLEALADEKRPDVIMYASHCSPAAVQAAAVAARSGVPFVLLPAIHFDHKTHVDRTARQLYRSADLVVALSNDERQWLIQHEPLPPERVLPFQCGWEEPAHERQAPRDGSRHLLTVGAFVRHKQVDHQLRALARLRDAGLHARLTVAGALADPGTLDRLMRLTDRLGIADAVDFRPDCTDEELTRLYRNADGFMFTSRSESLGLAVLDAIGFGTIPVVYPHPAYGDLVHSSGFGIVAARATPAALAEAVRAAMNGAAAPQDEVRRAFLNARAWSRAIAPMADALQRLSTYHSLDASR